jgi:hypothetical protein
MEKIYRNFVVGLLVLTVLAPLGLLAAGETFGEWGPSELKGKIGFVPQGLEKLSGIWDAPLPDYGIPGDESQTGKVGTYILTAVIGIVVCSGVLFFVGKKVAKD